MAQARSKSDKAKAAEPTGQPETAGAGAATKSGRAPKARASRTQAAEPAAAEAAAPSSSSSGRAPEKSATAERAKAGPAFTAGLASGGPLATTLNAEEMADLAGNLARLFERGRAVWETNLATQLAEERPINFDPFNTASAFAEFWQTAMAKPQDLAEATLKLWADQAELWRRATLKAVGAPSEPMVDASRDKRFKDPEWSENAVFDAIKQSYLLTSAYLQGAAHSAGDLDDRDRRKVEFFTRQFVEAMSPSNFFATNPEVLRATVEEKGANLLRGFEHLIEDFERGRGTLLIKQTDLDQFEVGRNMALTPGKVIFRNELIELIQYTPSTPTVQRRPVLICPPWINKYYILDLNPAKSLVKWMVDQGHSVFVISWVNPDEQHGDKEFVDYIAEGLFEAAAHVLDETQSEDLHVASYCIGGTMLATALAYLAQNPDHPLADRFASATYFTAQFEFSNAGELQIFVDDEQLALIDTYMKKGVLGAEKMAAAFNMLRASDLIWNFVVSNYLLGKDPFPFDLLYWNADSTRMPARCHKYYLEQFYRDDALARGELQLGEVTLDLAAIDIPSYHVATREDHIAPPDSVYRGVKLMGGPKKLVLAGSGHIAGVVNPPASGKYQHWVRDDAAFPETLDDWRTAAEERPGSWWTDWDGWLKTLNEGEPEVPGRQPGRRHNALTDAPGDYVRIRYDQETGQIGEV